MRNKIKRNLEENLKSYIIVGAIATLFLYAVGSVASALLDDLNMSWEQFILRKIMNLIPMITLLVIAILNYSDMRNPRRLLWVLLGVELLTSFIGRIDLFPYHPYMVRRVMGIFINYYVFAFLLIIVQILLILVVPAMKKGTMIAYSVLMGVIYFVAAVLENNITFSMITGVMYYFTFFLFAFELREENQLKTLGDRLLEALFGILRADEFDDDDDEYLFEEPDEEEKKEEEKWEKKDRLRRYTKSALSEKWFYDEWVDFTNVIKILIHDDVVKRDKKIEFEGDFLFLDYTNERGMLTYAVNYEPKITMTAAYTFEFEASDANCMLKKKTRLNQVFRAIEVDARADINLCDCFSKKGSFTIRLAPRDFEEGNFDELEEAMFEFIKILKLINSVTILEKGEM